MSLVNTGWNPTLGISAMLMAPRRWIIQVSTQVCAAQCL